MSVKTKDNVKIISDGKYIWALGTIVFRRQQNKESDYIEKKNID